MPCEKHFAAPLGDFHALQPPFLLSSKLLFLLVGTLWCVSTWARPALVGEDFNPKGLYDPLVYSLDNGLTVVLRPRHHVPNTTIFAVVGLGTAHYACGKREVPHFLEHMLFDAIADMSETELEQKMYEHGISANAFTDRDATVYQFAGYAPNAPVALNALSRFLYSGELSREAFQQAQAIIKQEYGGKPTVLERWLHRNELQKSALRYAVADKSSQYFGICPELDWGQNVTYEDVESAYETYYRPANTTLILVGDLDLEEARSWIEANLGFVESAGDASPPEIETAGTFAAPVYRGYAAQPGVGVAVPTGGLLDDDYYARRLIRHYLSNRLLKRLRFETGLTYSPSVYEYSGPTFGIFGIQADLDADRADAALEIIHEELERLRSSPMDEDEFRGAQLALLKRWAQGTETNRGFANYYRDSLDELRVFGALRNEEVAVASLTPVALQEAAHRLLDPDRIAVLRDESYMERLQSVLLVLGALVLAVAAGLFIWMSRYRRRDGVRRPRPS